MNRLITWIADPTRLSVEDRKHQWVPINHFDPCKQTNKKNKSTMNTWLTEFATWLVCRAWQVHMWVFRKCLSLHTQDLVKFYYTLQNGHFTPVDNTRNIHFNQEKTACVLLAAYPPTPEYLAYLYKMLHDKSNFVHWWVLATSPMTCTCVSTRESQYMVEINNFRVCI